MVLKSLIHQYEIIHRLSECRIYEVFLCSEYGLDQQGRFSITRIKENELTIKLIPIFVEMSNDSTFTDFYECFTKEGDLYVVFKHHEDPLLIDELKEDQYSLRERLEIGKNLFEAILLLDMPRFVLFEALELTNITLSKSNDVHFNYELNNILYYDEVTEKDIRERLFLVMGNLFGKEISLEVSNELFSFLDRLENQSYDHLIQLYEDYYRLYDQLIKHPNLEAIKPNTLIFRVWKRIKTIAKWSRPILLGAVLAIIVGYLIYTTFIHPTYPKDGTTIEQIGTLTIDNGR